MFKRLFVLLLLVAATVSVNTPARASTLMAWVDCQPLGHGRAYCSVSVSGGTGTYTSYYWQPTPYQGGGEWGLIYCQPYAYNRVLVTVTDSSGAMFTAEGWTECGDAW